MILAGDIGGTKTLLALYRKEGDRLEIVEEWRFPSRDYPGLEAVIESALKDQNIELMAAAFGVAGPVVNGRCEATNLPWIIDSKQLAATLRVESTSLINDLEAMANGINGLRSDELVTLNTGKADPTGNRALIAAGTGLGEAFLYWDGHRYRPSASEGGHSDFAPRTDEEIRLLQFLQKEFGHVSYERLLSGPGLVNIYRFILEDQNVKEPEWLTKELANNDKGVVITKAALEHTFEPCEAANRLFAILYGAEAGNLALKVLATGGLYIGGGIAIQIRPYLEDARFIEHFVAKGRYRVLLSNIPVHVILNVKTALLGAARHAAQL